MKKLGNFGSPLRYSYFFDVFESDISRHWTDWIITQFRKLFAFIYDYLQPFCARRERKKRVKHSKTA